MSEHTDSFGYWLRRRRKALDLTQEALAESVSCSPSAIRKIETDERRPSKHLAERLADRLSIPSNEQAAFLAAARGVQSSVRLEVGGQLSPSGLPFELSPAHSARTPLPSERNEPSAVASNYGPFVGRKKEMDELESALSDVRAGHGRFVMLAGEPGIGKTRTAQEIAARAKHFDAFILWGRCYEGKGAPPYWPWLQVIRLAIQGKDIARLQAEMGRGAAAIAEIVPEVHALFPRIAPVANLNPEQARFRLFDAITTFLRNISRGKPLVLILDDLHWADYPTLRLLEFLASENEAAPMLIVGTYRDIEISRKHPLSQTLAELTRQGRLRRFTLRGLDRDDVRVFIDNMVEGAATPRELVTAVHRQTEGNPLFVTEVVRLLADEGSLHANHAKGDEGWTMRIPEGVREVIGRRLDRLSESCNHALTIAAVIGRQFTMNQLSRLISDISTDRLVDVLEEALAARVIEETAGSIDQYQFTHALIGETLAAELSTTRRVRLHAQIGEALESLYGSKVEVHAAELAHHFAEASSFIGNAKLLHYSKLAGEKALSAYAYEEALEHFERALGAKNSEPIDAETAAILFGIGCSQMGTLERLQFAKAVESFRKAFDCFVDLGDVTHAVAIAVYPFPHFPGLEGAMAEFVSRALQLVPEDSLDAARLLSRNGRILGIHQADPAAARIAFDQSLIIARKHADTVLEIRTLASAIYIDYFQLRYREAIATGKRAIMLAEKTEELDAALTARYWVASCLRDLGDLDGLRDHAIAALPAAEKLRNRFWLAGLHWLNENVHRLKGEWNAAREASNRGLALSPMDFRLLWTRALMEHECGNIEEGAAHIERLVEVMRMTPAGPTPEHAVTAGALALCAAISGTGNRVAIVREAASIALTHASHLPALSRMARAGLAMVAVRLRDRELAAEQYKALRSHQEMLAFAAGPSADRVLGCLAITLGNLVAARVHFEDAIKFCRAGGFRPELAWTLHDFAEALIESSRRADRTRAINLLGEAETITTECSMRPLLDRIGAVRRSIPG